MSVFFLSCRQTVPAVDAYSRLLEMHLNRHHNIKVCKAVIKLAILNDPKEQIVLVK